MWLVLVTCVTVRMVNVTCNVFPYVISIIVLSIVIVLIGLYSGFVVDVIMFGK